MYTGQRNAIRPMLGTPGAPRHPESIALVTPPTAAAPDRDIPVALEAICCKALEKEAKNRFHDVNEMIEELQDYRAA